MPKAIVLEKLGGPENLKIKDVPTRAPETGEVVMQVEAVGLNRAELMYMQGHYFEQPQFPDAGIGYEAYGTVTAVGPGGDASQVGKKFGTVPGYSMMRTPSLRAEAVVPASALAAVPESFSAVDAAAVWMQYGTAYGALVEFGKVGKGDFVILTAASSSVGLAAIQIVKAQGGTAIATTRTSAKRQELLDLGADHVIATQEEDLPARVAEITGGKLARVVFDPVGGSYLAELAKAAAPEGTIFWYGMLSGEPTTYPLEGFAKGIALRGYSLVEMGTPAGTERSSRMKQYIHDHLADGSFQPKIAKTFALENIVEAYKYMLSNQQVGKIVVTI